MSAWNSADAPMARSAATCTDAGIRGDPHDLPRKTMSREIDSYVPEVIFEHEKTAKGEVCLGGGPGDRSWWAILNGKG